MFEAPEDMFNVDRWVPALQKFAAVTRLAVELFDGAERRVLGPIGQTPLFDLFRTHGYDPGMFESCARRCLREDPEHAAIAVDEAHGLAVVGAPLSLDGEIVGCAVAGYAFIDFCQAPVLRSLARDAHLPFDDLWQVARREQPIPKRRLVMHGDLLQVLGDTLLQENYRACQLQETAGKLEAAAAAKDEFLAVLSHELRTPLTPIIGWSRILKRGTDIEQVKHAADVIERNALRQSRLVEDLLDLNRIARGKVSLDFQVHDLHDIVQSAMEAVAAPGEKKHLHVDRVQAAEPLLVDGDAARLEQVFRNILTNAVKFTPEGGRITVTLARDQGANVVTVADSGIGIAPEFLPDVFEMFRQEETGTRRHHPGLGIGLALSKQLVDLHGGSIEVHSAGLGRGTTVAVRLRPVGERRVDRRIEDVSQEHANHPLKGVRVLVVEDMDDTREAAGLLLQRLGADVLEARDGIEALDMVSGRNPDVVLCDLRMPRMDGFEFISELHRSRPDRAVPVIAVSGLASEADHARSRAAGFDAHVDKPFDERSLVAAVDAAVHRSPNNH